MIIGGVSGVTEGFYNIYTVEELHVSEGWIGKCETETKIVSVTTGFNSQKKFWGSTSILLSNIECQSVCLFVP